MKPLTKGMLLLMASVLLTLPILTLTNPETAKNANDVPPRPYYSSFDNQG